MSQKSLFCIKISIQMLYANILLILLFALMTTTVEGSKGQMLQGMTTWYPERLLQQIDQSDSNDSENTDEDGTVQIAMSSNSTHVSSNSTTTSKVVTTNEDGEVIEEENTEFVEQDHETQSETNEQSADEHETNNENTNTTSTEETADAESEDDSDATKQAVAPTPVSTKTAESKGPEIILLQPRPRKDSRSTKANEPPCGSGVKGKVHFLATPGSRNLVEWRTIKPDHHGNCTVRFGTGVDETQFKTLRPRDGSGDNRFGKFPCGRTAGYESKEFRLPKDFDCDSCSLQLEWETSVGQIHQCADVSLEVPQPTGAASCAGLCQNNGVCSQGVCSCTKGFSGDYCQYQESSSDSSMVWYLIYFVVVIALIFALIFGAQRLKAKAQASRQQQLAQEDYENEEISQ